MKLIMVILVLMLPLFLFSPGLTSSGSTQVTSHTLLPSNAVGISDVGLLNTAQGNISYTFFTPTVVGLIHFYGGTFYTFNGSSYSPEASVQLDGVAEAGTQFYWVQNMPVITNLGNGEYSLELSDMVWNETTPQSSMSPVTLGEGTTEVVNGTSVYLYNVSSPILSHTPFTLELFTSTSYSGDNAHLLFYYQFINSTSVVLGEFDNVTIPVHEQPLFLVGGRNPSGLNGFELVVSSSNDFSTLVVKQWNSSAWLGYEFNNQYYTVPSALSTSFGITGNVNGEEGLTEFWNNTANLVQQEGGESTTGFLWNVSAQASYSSGHVNFMVTPGDTLWSVRVSNVQTGTQLFSYMLNQSTESFSEDLPQGYFLATFQLNAGSSVIYETQSSFSTDDNALVSVTSEVPYFYENGLREPSNSTVSVTVPVNISFPETYPIAQGERLFLLYTLVNGMKSGDEIRLSSPGTYSVKAVYSLQYEVGFPFNVTVLVDNVKENFHYGWVDANSSVEVPSQIDSYAPGTRAIVSPLNFTAYTPINVSLKYITQYLVRFPFNLTFKVGTQVYYLNSSWINLGAPVFIPGQIHYLNPEVRYVISSSKFEVSSPINFTPLYVTQYLVRFPFNLTVLVNSSETNFAQAWVNSSSIIASPPQQVVISKGVMYNVTPFSFQVRAPVNYTPSYIVNYYLNLSATIPAQVNGTNRTISSGYYPTGTQIQIFRVFYVTPDERDVIISNVSSLTVESPGSFQITLVRQDLLRLPFNMTFYLNGERMTGTYSWVNVSTLVGVPSQFIYVNSTERYSISGENFTMSTPEDLKLPYITEYLVTVNGNSSWYPVGSTVTLIAPQNFFQTVTWKGTYQEPNGATLKVNQPIVETPSYSLNYVNVGVTAVVLILVVALLIAIFKRRKGSTKS